MSSERQAFIFSSHTGLGVNGALAKLVQESADRGVDAVHVKLEPHLTSLFAQRFPNDPQRVDIESPTGMQYLLWKPKQLVTKLWGEALGAALRAEPLGAVELLSLHPILYHAETREFFCPVDLDFLRNALADNRLVVPAVISLIDDVYDVYRRLRAPGQLFCPTETKEPFQSAVEAILDIMLLLDWRANEMIAAEQIARALGAKHYVLALKHPTSVACDLLFSQKLPVYVSHPITQVRELEARRRMREADAIKAEVNRLVDLLVRSDGLIPFFPTSIDEFRIRRERGFFYPRLASRWPLREESELLFCPPVACRGMNPLDPERWHRAGRRHRSAESRALSPLLSALSQRIEMHVGSRDRKLVEQTAGLVVLRPYFNGILSAGVHREILHRNILEECGVAERGARKCVVATPSGDLEENRVRTLVKELQEYARVGGRKIGAAELGRIESGLRSDQEFLSWLLARTLTGQELQQRVDRAQPGVTFEGMPRASGPLGGEVRVAQRAWLSQRWQSIARDLQDDPIRKCLRQPPDLAIDSESAEELVLRARAILGG